MEDIRIIHLMGRLGFGMNARALDSFKGKNFEDILNDEEVELVETRFNELETLRPRDFMKADKAALIKKSQEAVIKLNTEWVKRMIHSDNPIHEKMTLFWHHHFACEIKNPVFAREFSNVIRKNSLGNFRDLLLGVSRSAAMIAYLNTRQNKKSSPNEDWARELCELFTLGEGNGYTEEDIQEIARAFTGWNHDLKGQFKLRRFQHDRGAKTIFGKTGNYGGEEVIDLILEKKACASFIARNVYTYFVNATVEEKNVMELAGVLYDSDYDIKKMMVHLAEAEWFYAEKNIMTRIKSPIELLIGMGRQFRLDSGNELSWILYQRILNQVLYRPPNVAGWKTNREWINSNSLSLRLRLPSVMLAANAIEIEDRPDYDADPMMAEQVKKGIKALTSFRGDWDHFFEVNKGMDYETLFFNNKLSVQARATLTTARYRTEKERVLQMMTLPEYQMT